MGRPQRPDNGDVEADADETERPTPDIVFESVSTIEPVRSQPPGAGLLGLLAPAGRIDDLLGDLMEVLHEKLADKQGMALLVAKLGVIAKFVFAATWMRVADHAPARRQAR